MAKNFNPKIILLSILIIASISVVLLLVEKINPSNNQLINVTDAGSELSKVYLFNSDSSSSVSITVNQSVISSRDFSLKLWIYIDQSKISTPKGILAFGNDTNGLQLYQRVGEDFFTAILSVNGVPKALRTSSIKPGIWNQIVIASDGTDLTYFYFNKYLVDAFVGSSFIPQWQNTMKVGDINNLGASSYVKNIKLYDYFIDPNEVIIDYQTELGQQSLTPDMYLNGNNKMWGLYYRNISFVKRNEYQSVYGGFYNLVSDLDKKIEQIGAEPNIHLSFLLLDNLEGFNREMADVKWSRGGIPQYAIGMVGNNNTVWYKFETVMANPDLKGRVDRFIEGAKAWNKPFFIRLNSEVGGDWQPYTPGINGVTANDYIQDFRNWRNYFRSKGETKSLWTWTVGGNTDTDLDGFATFPGNEYIDWVAANPYNFAGTVTEWKSFRTLFQAFYNKLIEVAPDKPMMIGEMASSDEGGNKAQWIRETFLDHFPNNFPRIKLFNWFDVPFVDDDYSGDLRIDSSPEVLTAFKESVKNPIYCRKGTTNQLCSLPTKVANNIPVANAGLDRNITLPTNSIRLSAALSSDLNNDTLSFKWEQLSGPNSGVFENVNAAETNFTNLVAGVYDIKLTTSDPKLVFSSDTVQIKVGSNEGVICGSLDVNNDNKISPVDLSSFLAMYGAQCSDIAPTTGCKGKDANNDKKIGPVDFSNILGKYGKPNCL